MTDLPTREELVRRFRTAAVNDDVATITALLDPGVLALTDSAGDVIAPTAALRGPDEVIPEVIANLSLRSGGVVDEHTVNGAPALVVRYGRRVRAIVSFGISDGRITHLWITRSPWKLQRWN